MTRLKHIARLLQTAGSAVVILSAACGSDDNHPDLAPMGNAPQGEAVESADGGQDTASAEAGAASPEAAVSPVRGVMYHLGNRADATTLEVKDDGTFRWVIQGCDFGGGDIGRWTTEGDARVLRARDGRERFRWPGEGAITELTRVVLRASGEGVATDLQSASGTVVQSWEPGARCARCGGAALPPGAIQLGPTGADSCDDPFGKSNLDY